MCSPCPLFVLCRLPIQGLAKQLEKKLGCAATWHKQAWYEAVLFNEANQSGKGTGFKVDSLSAVAANSAAGRYKAELKSLDAGGHLAHFLMMLRNVLAHQPRAFVRVLLSWSPVAQPFATVRRRFKDILRETPAAKSSPK